MKLIIAFKKIPDKEWYGKLAAKLISWRTQSQYFHVEIVIDKKWISSHVDNRGLQIRDLKPLYDRCYDYYELYVHDLTGEREKIFWKFLKSQVGSGYDWKGILLSQFINLNWETREKWFCSEIVTKILQMLYVEEFIMMKPNQIAPVDVFNVIEKIGKKIEITPQTNY